MDKPILIKLTIWPSRQKLMIDYDVLTLCIFENSVLSGGCKFEYDGIVYRVFESIEQVIARIDTAKVNIQKETNTKKQQHKANVYPFPCPQPTNKAANNCGQTKWYYLAIKKPDHNMVVFEHKSLQVVNHARKLYEGFDVRLCEVSGSELYGEAFAVEVLAEL